MAYASRSVEAFDLMVVVERLSAQDQRRIVRLIELLQRASEMQALQIQGQLRELIAREPYTHAECLAGIDRLIAWAERGLDNRVRSASCADPLVLSSDFRFSFPHD